MGGQLSDSRDGALQAHLMDAPRKLPLSDAREVKADRRYPDRPSSQDTGVLSASILAASRSAQAY
jgi:hypothetical protein